MKKLPQFLRRQFASVLACLVPHVQIDRADKDFYVGKRYVAPINKGWLRDNYVRLLIIIMCWMRLLTNIEYWDGQKIELTYELGKDAESLRDEFFPVQGPQPATNIFTSSSTPGLSTVQRFVKETPPAA